MLKIKNTNSKLYFNYIYIPPPKIRTRQLALYDKYEFIKYDYFKESNLKSIEEHSKLYNKH
jgi:hypothetical protein